MMDESTSRSNAKSCIVYTLYFENYKPKTSFYYLLNLDGDGTANSIVNALATMWDKDGLFPTGSYWLATDNAFTFTGMCRCIS